MMVHTGRQRKYGAPRAGRHALHLEALRVGTIRPGEPLLASTEPFVADRRDAKREEDLRFEREALPWLDDVYRFARSMTHDEADADDLVQETYLRAYRSWHTFEPGSDCRRWLFTICRNVFLRTREREEQTRASGAGGSTAQGTGQVAQGRAGGNAEVGARG